MSEADASRSDLKPPPTGEAGKAPTGEAGRAKVFISYSRDDVGFADELVLALKDKGFEPLFDRDGIDAGERWKDRLGALIISCDTVVFVLSGRSVASPYCQWELEEAGRTAKRILIVLPSRAEGLAPPPQLSEISWIHCYRDPAIPGSGMIAGVLKLERALKTDLAWLREQTRLTDQASMWKSRTSDDDAMLLRGRILEQAWAWARTTPPGAVVSPLVLEYLDASATAEARLKAEVQTRITEREDAVKAAEAAIDKRKEVERHFRIFTYAALVFAIGLTFVTLLAGYAALNTTVEVAKRSSALFAQQADQYGRRGDYGQAMLMALAGDPAAETRWETRLLQKDGFPLTLAALERAYSHNRLIRTINTNSEVWSLAVAPLGSMVATGQADGTTRLWRIDSGQLGAVLGSPGRAITSVAFSSDGDFLVTGADDGVVTLWPVTGADPIAIFALPDTPRPISVRAVAFSPDGKHVLAGYDDNTARLWPTVVSTKTKPRPVTFTGHRQPVSAVAFSPDSKRILTGSYDGTAKLWLATGGAARYTFTSDSSGIRTVGFSPDGRSLLTGANDGAIRLWPSSGGAAIASFIGDGAEIYAAAFSPDGSRILAGYLNGDIRLWPSRLSGVTTRAPLAVFRANEERVNAVAFSPDGATLFSGEQGGAVRIWRTRTPSTLVMETHGYEPGGAQRITSLAISPDATRFLIGDARTGAPGGAKADTSGVASLWPTPEGATTLRLAGHSGAVTALAFSPDGKRILTGGADRRAHLWNAADGALLDTFPDHGGTIRAIAISPDGKHVLTGADDGKARLWPTGGAAPITLASHVGAVWALGFAPDGRTFVTGDDEGKARIFPLAGGEPIAAFRAHDGPIFAIAFSPDGKSFLTGGYDGAPMLWSLPAGKPLALFQGASDTVTTLAISPDGSLVLAGFADGLARLWRINGGQPIATYGAPGRQLYAVAFTADGRAIITADQAGTARRWDIDPIFRATPRDHVRLACTRLAEIGVTGFSTRPNAARYAPSTGCDTR